jgi:hypothetical protein
MIISPHSRQIIITSQMSTKLLNADGSPGNFETGAKAAMVPQLGKPSGVALPHTTCSYAQFRLIYQAADRIDW